MRSDLARLSPTGILLIVLLAVCVLWLVKQQRWHSPEAVLSPAAGLPELVGPAEDGTTGLHRLAPNVRVLLRSSSHPLEPDSEGYPGVVQVEQQGDRYLRICRLDLDAYVAQVVTGELPESWDLEVKRAQAVAARSYVLGDLRPEQAYDIRASALAQNFRREVTDPEAVQAAQDTRGVVLRQGEQVVKAFYHATCGGSTVSPREFWGMVRPRWSAVPCDHCASSPLYRWSYEADLAGLGEAMDREVVDLWVESADSTGRVARIAVETPELLEVMTGEEFRAAVGFTRIRSTGFTLALDEGVARFDGFGSGHGVGMCQWGARGMSQEGASWREILRKYYPETAIETIY
jgi:stage II sporulation protein D